MSEEEKIKEIDNKLDKIEDNETTINLLYQKVDLLEGIIGKQKSELEKKDKVIDLMAKAWKQDDTRTVEEIIKYFERKVEEE